MTETGNTTRGSPLASLRRLVPRKLETEAEFCELCSGALTPDHQHLLELAKRKIVCACDACSLLFSSQAAAHYRRIPRRIRMLRDFKMDDVQWDSLLIPIGLAFFFHSSSAGRVAAYYPSPAGATESLLNLESWHEVTEANPILKQIEPDVEALLVHRLVGDPEYFIVPIDQCYRLVGVIRKNWRGFSGGPDVWKQVRAFFTSLRECCPQPVSPRVQGAVAAGRPEEQRA